MQRGGFKLSKADPSSSRNLNTEAKSNIIGILDWIAFLTSIIVAVKECQMAFSSLFWPSIVCDIVWSHNHPCQSKRQFLSSSTVKFPILSCTSPVWRQSTKKQVMYHTRPTLKSDRRYFLEDNDDDCCCCCC